MSVLYLSEQDVEAVVDMPAAIDALSKAFRELHRGRADNVPRRRAKAPGFRLHTLAAAAEYLGVAGWKNYTTTREGARFLVALYDISSGRMLSQISADRLGQIRTGAASGVATQRLAREDAASVGIFGTGYQAETQLEAVCAVRRISSAFAYSRTPEKRAAFAERMSARLGIEVSAVETPAEAVRDRDVIVTATTSREPLFDGGLISPGTHLNLVGSNDLNRTEVDRAAIERADRIVCDSIEGCRVEAGDFVASLEAGAIGWEQMEELGAVVEGKTGPPRGPQEITIFKSVGLALEDVVLGMIVYERAREAGLGIDLPIEV